MKLLLLGEIGIVMIKVAEHSFQEPMPNSP